MKNNWLFFASIFQIAVGIFAIVAFAVVAFNGENMMKWIITLLLAIAFVVIGIRGIIDYTTGK